MSFDEFIYKPPYNIETEHKLLDLLKEAYDDNHRGILYEYIDQSIPNLHDILKKYTREIVVMKRRSDKQKYLFYRYEQPSQTVSCYSLVLYTILLYNTILYFLFCSFRRRKKWRMCLRTELKWIQRNTKIKSCERARIGLIYIYIYSFNII